MAFVAALCTALALAAIPTHTPPVPAAALGDAARPRALGKPEILYINFDGGVLHAGCGNQAHYNCSTLADLFDGYVGPFPGNETQRIGILQATRKAVADFGVRVVVDRPPDDVDYTMVMYGDLGPQDFAGIAPYIDCEDAHANDTSFTAAFDTSNTGATVILQEAAHTWGLEHVDAEFDILNPFKSAGVTQRFQDECYRIVSNTDLQPTPGSCNQVHTKFCDTGHQNSWREMNYLFGPAVPDTTAPELDIVAPIDDESFVLPAKVPLLGEITDDLDPQFYHFAIYQGSEMLFESDDIQLDLLLDNPPAGDYRLRVVVSDAAGNTGEDEVSFTILPAGSELPAPEGADVDDTEGGCALAPARTAAPAWLAAFALVLARGRRRRP